MLILLYKMLILGLLMKQVELAKKLNLSQSTISFYLNGRLKPNLDNALKLEKLGFPLEIWGDKKKIIAFLQKNNLKLIYKKDK